MKGGVRLFAALLGVLTTVLATAAGAQPSQVPAPQYLPFAEFSSGDSAPQVAAKQVYNSAVERYNKALYDYHVTLGQHDQLVDLYNRAGTPPAEQERARAEAVPLRAKLQTLRRDVESLTASVDQARRKAGQAGVTLTR
jgi:hypothetical protein